MDLGCVEADIRELTETPRPSASRGEADAARLIAKNLEMNGARVQLQEEEVVGNYWLPLGLLSGLGLLAGSLARAGRARPIAAFLGAAAAFGIWDDITARRRWFRKLLPKERTTNVVGELDADGAERTLVIVAHHDAAPTGIIFHPRIPEIAWRLAPRYMGENDEGPPLMLPVVMAPALAGLAAVSRSRKLGMASAVLSSLMTAIFLDIACRRTVDGANDNASGVAAMQGLARRLSERPLGRTRVMLVSTGSEESLLEGMQAFSKRWFPHLNKESTFFLGIDTVGSGNLCVLAGEGMVKMREYPKKAVKLVEGEAEKLGVNMVKGLRHRNSTDALYPLAAGYLTAMLGSVDDRKLPSNYHWKTDTADNVDLKCVSEAIDVCEATARAIDRQSL